MATQTFADIIHDEITQVAAGATACGHVCPTFALTCVRVAHPQNPDTSVAHVAVDAVTGDLCQWVCSPPFCPDIP